MNHSEPTSLCNADLAPTGAAQRTWRWYHYCALWIGMVMCIPAYTLAASLIDSGMSAMQAVVTVLLANTIVLVPMLLIGHAGTKYGIPYAVLARASFGTRGCRHFCAPSWPAAGSADSCCTPCSSICSTQS